MSLTEALQVATSLWLLPHIVRGELGVGCAGDAVAVRLAGHSESRVSTAYRIKGAKIVDSKIVESIRDKLEVVASNEVDGTITKGSHNLR